MVEEMQKKCIRKGTQNENYKHKNIKILFSFIFLYFFPSLLPPFFVPPFFRIFCPYLKHNNRKLKTKNKWVIKRINKCSDIHVILFARKNINSNIRKAKQGYLCPLHWRQTQILLILVNLLACLIRMQISLVICKQWDILRHCGPRWLI